MRTCKWLRITVRFRPLSRVVEPLSNGIWATNMPVDKDESWEDCGWLPKLPLKSMTTSNHLSHEKKKLLLSIQLVA